MNKIKRYKIILIITLFLLTDTRLFASYQENQIKPNSGDLFVPGEILIKFKDSSANLKNVNILNNINTEQKVTLIDDQIKKISSSLLEEDIEIKDTLTSGNLAIFTIKNNESVEELIERLKQNPEIEYVEPNYNRIPNLIETDDTFKENLWGLDNTGQVVNGVTGLSDSDMDMPEAWALNEGSEVIVAIIDSGVAYNHPDLVGRMWDGTDCKDENGVYLGGCVHGYNYTNDTKIPLPAGSAHSTHIAGTIGATKNNGMGIVGVAPNVKIMSLNVGTSTFSIYAIVKAIDFARENGAKIINASFSGEHSNAERDAVKRFVDAGGIFVASAGNDSRSNDIYPTYPTSENIDGIISVAATGQSDTLAGFSNWGLESVDIAAPGVNIYSTYCSSDCSSQSYGYMNGTSMSAPHVVGLAALIWGIDPTLNNIAIKNLILSTGDSIASLGNKLLTGKRINAYNAIDILDDFSSYVPNAGYTIDNLIPASNINYSNTDGEITVSFKVKDTYSNLTIQLKDFSYSTDGGITWQTPTGGDTSDSLSTKWNNNNYISKDDYSGSTYSFTFNSRSDSSPNINMSTGNDTKVRFRATDGINTSDYVESEEFNISNYFPELNITQPASSISVNLDSYNLIGETDAGSLVEVYRGDVLIAFLQLNQSETDFIISVELNQNSGNYFEIKTTEPIYDSEKTVEIPLIIEEDIPYEWTVLLNAGARNWKSIASSSDGTKLVAIVSGGYIYTSIDSGETWVEQISAGSRNWNSVVSSADGNILVAGVSGGYVYVSDNSGFNWTEINSYGTHSWANMVSSSIGSKIVFAENMCVNSGQLHKTINNGHTWASSSSSGLLYFFYIANGTKLISADGYGGSSCFGGGDGGYIKVTTNDDSVLLNNAGVRKWRSIVASSDGMKLVAGVSDGYIYISEDSGDSWSEISSNGTHDWTSLKSSINATKLASIADGQIYTSFNSGNTWILRSSNKLFSWSSIDLSDDGNKLFATVNGGNIYLYKPTIQNTAPSLFTSSATSITKTTATLNGSITSTGGASPTIRGFNYGLTTSYGTNTTEMGTFETENYSSNILSLTCGTTYHYRSYATNEVDTSYGDDQTFVTSRCSSGGGGGGDSIPNTKVTPIMIIKTPESVNNDGCLPGYLYNINTGDRCNALGVISNNTEVIKINIDRILRYGVTGQDVKQLQIYLNTHNYPISFSGTGSLNNETTYFGSKTKEAVVKFQLANKLTGDGVVGPMTRALLK